MSWIEIAKKVKAEHQYRCVNVETGEECAEKHKKAVLLDGVTANMLITVYEALNDENKAKFTSLPILKAVTVGWKLVK